MKRTLLIIPSLLALLSLLGMSRDSSAAGLAAVTPLAPAAGSDGRAGLCYSFYPDSTDERAYLDLARNAGSRWDRFDFVWPRLENQDGSWRVDARDAYDDLVDDLDADGLGIVGILLWTPDWAATSGMTTLSAPELDQRPAGWYAPVPESSTVRTMGISSASSSPPQGLYQPWDDWTTGDGDPINYWGRFVYKVVDRYGDRVKHWEMWNEPEWTYFWTGTSSDYARLLKVGYQATKAACADCQVLFGGLHYWANTDYFKWVLNTLRDYPDAAAHDYFFDVLSVHLYSRSSNTYDVVNDIRDEMILRASDHPIWLTETGVPMWDDGTVDPHPDKYDYAATQEEAASYLIQSYANAWASGVERYFFFRTHDADMIEYFGVARNDRSLRPSYPAYQVVTRYLIDPAMVTRWTYGNGARRVTLWGTPHGKVSVLWNTTPDAVTLDYPAILPTATWVTRHGEERGIEAGDDGAYSINLPGATANLVSDPGDYIIGGEPYLVIEEDTVAPSKTVVDPLDATTNSETVTINCRASDDEAGIWGYELLVQKDGGIWQRWGALHPAPIAFTDGEPGSTYCFRVRAWDLAGNPGAWADREPCTTLGAVTKTRDVQIDIPAVFGDSDGDGKQGDDEGFLTDLSFRLVDADGRHVMALDSGSSCSATVSVSVGDYSVVITPEDWPSFPPEGFLPAYLPLSVGPGEVVLTAAYDAVGLLPHRSSLIFPFIARNG